MSDSAIQFRQKPQFERLPPVIVQTVSELDKIREVAQGTSLEISQVQPGRMTGTFAHIFLGDSSIHLNSLSQSARGFGPASASRLTFLVFPDGRDCPAGTFNSESIEPSKMLVYRPGSEFEGSTIGPFQDWVFTVEEDEFRNTVLRHFHRDLPKFSASCTTLVPATRYLDALRRLAKSAMNGESSANGNRLHVRLLEVLARSVMSAVRVEPGTTRIAHFEIVQMIEEYVHANHKQSLSIAELCAASNVSERTLRNAFQNILGCSPNAYLKSLRLNQVRRRLKEACHSDTFVTEIAMECGFTHLGHFSRDYRQFFGESPSETLRRQEF